MGKWLDKLTRDKPDYATGPKHDVAEHLSEQFWSGYAAMPQITGLPVTIDRVERIVRGIEWMEVAAATAADLAARLDRCMTSFRTEGLRVFKPAQDIRGDRIEPDETADSLKLCMYKVFANAQFEEHSWRKVVEDTMCMRDEYWVSFDEDIWADALAEFYQFSLLQRNASYQQATAAVEAGARGDQFYLSVTQQETNVGALIGHAVFGTIVDGGKTVKPRIIDNENRTVENKIDSKFNIRKIDIYKRSGSVALANKALQPAERMKKLSDATKQELHRLTLNE